MGILRKHRGKLSFVPKTKEEYTAFAQLGAEGMEVRLAKGRPKRGKLDESLPEDEVDEAADADETTAESQPDRRATADERRKGAPKETKDPVLTASDPLDHDDDGKKGGSTSSEKGRWKRKPEAGE